MNDICNLTTVLGLIFVMRYFKSGFFATITDEAFYVYAEYSALEAGLEIIYTFVTPILIRKFTRYKYFHPTVGGRDIFVKNLLPFTAFVIFMFPLTLTNLINRPPSVELS
jgi:hypothetical protein